MYAYGVEEDTSRKVILTLDPLGRQLRDWDKGIFPSIEILA